VAQKRHFTIPQLWVLAKVSQLSPIGSRPRFFQRRTHEASTFPLCRPKGWLKNST